MKHTDPTTLPVTDAPVLSPAAELLLRAADAIEAMGHAKRALCQANGSMCALGALNYAAAGDPRDHCKRFDHPGFLPAYLVLSDYVGGNIPDWNNAPERTKDEVIAALRAAALS